jgi:hypothetical protein
VIADTGIASGHATAADILFLVAAVLAVLAALGSYRPAIDARIIALGWLALACVAVGLLLL